MSALCVECGGMMLCPDGYDTHPTCDPRYAPDIRREQIRAANRKLGQQGRRQALKSDPEARGIGLGILRRAAEALPWLSADDIRDDLEAAGVPTKMYGGLWTTAVARSWVEEGDEIVSGGESAHGKKIRRYRSRIHRAVSA